MAGSVPTITNGSINAINGLTDRPVFFLTLGNAQQPNLVVKGEDALGAMSSADAEVSIKWTSKLMKNVNNSSVNTKIMGAGEINIFKTAARAAYPQPNLAQHKFLGANYRWVKMPYVQGLSDADMWNEDLGAWDNSMIKNTLKKFMEPQVWTDLGKVIAVDIFNGNNDRLMFSAQPNDTVQQISVVWANKGNIMFLAGGNSSVIGLDTIDPSGQAGPSNLGSGQANNAVLQVLHDRCQGQRAAFAQKCTDAVAADIASAMKNTQKLTIKVQGAPLGQDIIRVEKDDVDDLLAPFSVPFLQGFNAGIRDLKQYLQGKVAQYGQQNQQAQRAQGWVRAQPGQRRMMGVNRGPQLKTVPQGVLDRMQYLGW